MNIEAYIEGKTITYIPYVTGETINHIVQSEPFHKQDILNGKEIGNKVLEIFRQIVEQEKKEKIKKKQDDRKILREIGYKSWAKVKEKTNMLAIYTEPEDNEIVFIEPMYPTGRGYAYVGSEEESIKVRADDPRAIGAAVIDCISRYKKKK